MTRAPALLQVRRLGAAALALLVPAVAAAQPSAPVGTAADERPLAVLGDDTLRVSAFEPAYVDHIRTSGANDTPEERRAFLDEWIDRHLLAREAVRRGLDATPAFRDGLALATRHAAAGRVLDREALESMPPVTDRDLRWAYVYTGTTLDVRVLFHRSEADARAAHARLVAGADFAALASENRALAGVDTLAGYLGRVTYTGVDDAFAEAAFATPVGAFTEPVRTRLGWYIVRVERASQPALLTDDGFAARREGLASLVRERRRRLAGDRFVQATMAALDVRVNAEALALVAPALAHAADLDAARRALADLRPDVVLARFTRDGAPQVFTAAQFEAWLPALPLSEVQRRPAAALGRALRNEVLAEVGLARGWDRDREARLDIDRWRLAALSSVALDAIAAEPAPEPDERLVREAFLRLRLDEDARVAFEDVRDRLAADLRASLHQIDTVRGLRAGASILLDPGSLATASSARAR